MQKLNIIFAVDSTYNPLLLFASKQIRIKIEFTKLVHIYCDIMYGRPYWPEDAIFIYDSPWKNSFGDPESTIIPIFCLSSVQRVI